jgi:signal transduction histidine kinase/tetratricopeptide (TPR) repeat protein
MRKKLFGFCIIAFATYGSLLAQAGVADSLKKLLQSHSQNDTIRINILNNLAKESRRSNPKLTDSVITVALNLSNQLNYKKGKGNALAIKAVRYYDVSDYPSATKTFDEAKQLLQSANDISGEIYFYRMKATLLMDEGNYALSLDDFLKGLKLAQESGDVKQAIDIKGTIGYLYNVIGDYEKAIPYQTEALKQAERINYKVGISRAYNAIGKTYKTQGKYPASLEAYTKGLHVDEQLKDTATIYVDYGNIGDVHERMGQYKEAFSFLRPAWNFDKLRPGNTKTAWDEWLMGKVFTHSGNADSGLYYAKHSLQLAHQMGWRLYLREITFLIAESAANLNKWDTAYKYLALSSAYKDTLTGQDIARKTTMLQAGFELDKKQAEIELQKAENKKNRAFLLMVLGGLASVIVLAVILLGNNRQKRKSNVLLQKQKEEIDNKAKELTIQKDNLEQSYHNVEQLGEIGRMITSSLSVQKIMSTVYDNVNALMDASVFGIGIYNKVTETIEFPATYEDGKALPFYANAIDDENRFAVICFKEKKEIIMGHLNEEHKAFTQEVVTPHEGKQAVSLIYLPLVVKEKVLGVITVQSFQQNAFTDYHLFMLRNIAIYTAIALENAESFNTLHQTLQKLRTTQSQLIQSEKMASLGELTAGIAHEIQNPLNFVNNFSEVSSELADELKDAVEKNDNKQAVAIANDIKKNLNKINHHGKRADSIVKGMLQHSRASSGKKEPTDINALTDEYLRLSYHGLRAKDKSFNATLETDFDESLEKVNIISQDVGRVILNLFTNAFYSVAEKKKMITQGYAPTVSVSTKKIKDVVEIKIKDNGNGIPQKVLDKIFQPFFTTKPTGEGTGLGLSMSYDIIKAHGGELKVETKEGEGAEFIITIPTDKN